MSYQEDRIGPGVVFGDWQGVQVVVVVVNKGGKSLRHSYLLLS